MIVCYDSAGRRDGFSHQFCEVPWMNIKSRKVLRDLSILEVRISLPKRASHRSKPLKLIVFTGDTVQRQNLANLSRHSVFLDEHDEIHGLSDQSIR